jgi:DNA-binding MarR family transcriptional regulator
MPRDEEIGNINLQFLKEVYKDSENNIPIKGYIIGNKLGLDPNQTKNIIDFLSDRGLVNMEPSTEQISNASRLKITDEGKAIISSNKPLTR